MGADRAPVVVVGAGVVGVTTACQLARAGFDVTVLEQHAQAGLGTSAENGAQLSYCFSDPISSPAVLRRLPAIMAGRDPGISASFGQLLRSPVWSLQFLRNCFRSRCRANTAALTALAMRSRELMADIREATGIEFSFSKAGRMVLYENASALEDAARISRARNQLGCDLKRLNREACIEIEPALGGWQASFAGGLYASLDEAGDAGAWCRGLADWCERSLGVRFLYNSPVTGLVRRGQQIVAVRSDEQELPASQVVICTGTETQSMRRMLRVRTPILPLKGYSVTVAARADSPHTSVASAEHRIVFARLGERVRIAGLAHVRGNDGELDAAAAEQLLATAQCVFPDAADYSRVISRWCGLRPLTPDGLPVITRVSTNNLVLNTGHGGLGWTLAAGSADLVVRIIKGERLRFVRGYENATRPGLHAPAGAGGSA